MSQTFVLPATGQTGNTALGTNTPGCLEALRSTFSGTTAPTSPTPVEGQLFAKTDTNELQMYDGAAWRTIAFYTASITAVAILKDGTVTYTADQPMGGFKLTGLAQGSANGHSLRWEDRTLLEKLATAVTVVVPATFAATMNFPGWVAPVNVTVLGGYFTLSTITGGNLTSDVTNYYTIKMRNCGAAGAGTTDIGSSITNNGVTITANDSQSIGSTSASVSAGEAVSIRVEVTAAPTALQGGFITMTIYYKNA